MHDNQKKKKKTIFLAIGLVILLVAGTVIGIIIYQKQTRSSSEPSTPSNPPSPQFQREKNIFKIKFLPGIQELEKLEQEVETSVVKHQPLEGNFTPESYADWLKKSFTKQEKTLVYATFPENEPDFFAVYDKVANGFYRILDFIPLVKNNEGKIDWAQNLEIWENYFAPFEKEETYQAVKIYIEQTLNPALTKNFADFSPIFSEKDSEAISQWAQERMILAITGNKLLNLCEYFQTQKLPTNKQFGSSAWKKITKPLPSSGFAKEFTESYEFNSKWGKDFSPPFPFFPPTPPKSPPPPGLSPAEIEARKKCLAKNGQRDEKVLLPLLENIQYQPDEDSSLEKWMDLRTELMKKKQWNFTEVPQSSYELSSGYNKMSKAKREFAALHFIPRKSNGDIDWINYLKQLEKQDEFPSFSLEQAENYLKKKTNPTFDKMFDLTPNDPGTVEEEIAALNKQLNYYVENFAYATKLFWKLGTLFNVNHSYWIFPYTLFDKFTSGKEVKINLESCFIELPSS